jgi:hypothetical protein
VILHFMTLYLKVFDDLRLEIKSSVIASDVNSHARILSISSRKREEPPHS